MICLDTNVVIAAITRRAPVVRQRLIETLSSGAAVAVSAVVLFELRYGIAKSERREANMAALDSFLTLPIEPLAFDADDAAETGDIRATLERGGIPIGHYDLLIAGQARRRGATLVTANGREFRRVTGLRVEDWAT